MKTVELFHIDRKCRAVTSRTFPVLWFSPGGACVADIFASRTFNGGDAEFLVSLFTRAFIRIEDETLCGHYPNYGLRCFDEGNLTLETTVCLSCANWIGVGSDGAERFCIASDVFPELSSELQHLIPLSPTEASDLQRISEMQHAFREQYDEND